MKKPKTYNLSKDVYEAINKKAVADGRKDSDWLNRFLTAELVEVEIKPVKTALVEPKPKFNFKSELLALGVNEDVLSDWLKVRSKKKASNTKTALKGLITEITKSGLMVNDAIEYAASKSWSGFKAQWYFNEQPNNQAQQFSKVTEQNINTIGEWLNE
tara:strand:+ start:2290 stop:2763 length:474 start_codon:yes stop_codon:yes gene_type:complete